MANREHSASGVVRRVGGLGALLMLTFGAGCASSGRPEPGVHYFLGQQAGSPDGFADARALFFQSSRGESNALKPCEQYFEAAYEQRPNDARVVAYLGGCRLLEAAVTPWVWDKGKLAKQGLDLLDQAVRMSPDDLEVRFLRGVVCYHLPSFMARQDVAAADLSLVAGQACAAAARGTLPRTLAAAALYHYGLLKEEAGDAGGATAAWRQAVQVGPETRAGLAAAQRLKPASGS